MKVGDYVRTENGEIGTIIDCPEQLKKDYGKWLWFETTEEQRPIRKEQIDKSSSNIIDLIEVGDYVNGHRVNYINKDREHFNISFGDENFNLKSKFNSDIYWLSKEDIETIVTKEQFESMEYKVGE